MYYLESAGACGGVRKEVAIMETVLAVLEVMLRKTEVVVGEGRGHNTYSCRVVAWEGLRESIPRH